MAFCWNMNLVVSTMALARSPPDKQQCTEICFFFFFFLFSYTPRRQNSGESFGNSRIGEVPKKAQGKAKQVERISIFFGGGATTISVAEKKDRLHNAIHFNGFERISAT
jgi:coproporphyrinogen III oxidase-like Fe-S oxidoreductase